MPTLPQFECLCLFFYYYYFFFLLISLILLVKKYTWEQARTLGTKYKKRQPLYSGGSCSVFTLVTCPWKAHWIPYGSKEPKVTVSIKTEDHFFISENSQIQKHTLSHCLTQIQKIILPSTFTAAVVMYYSMCVSYLLTLYQQNRKSELD